MTDRTETLIAKRNQYGHVLWTPRLDRLLGRLTDELVGSLLCCSSETVARRRRKRGIVAYRPETTWTAKRDAMLGTVPDDEAATVLGVSPLAVRIRRHRLGLKPVATVGSRRNRKS
jgi:hypothetical protein